MGKGGVFERTYVFLYICEAMASAEPKRALRPSFASVRILTIAVNQKRIIPLDRQDVQSIVQPDL